jgi:hypothetical protein
MTYHNNVIMYGVRGGAVGWGIMLQAW